MSILEPLPDFETTICIDGEPLMEYESDDKYEVNSNQALAQHQNAITVTKYIESTSNKHFTIKLVAVSTYKFDSPSLEIQIKIDGNWADGFCLQEPNPLKEIKEEDEGVSFPKTGRTGRHLLKTFSFGKIDPTSDDAKLDYIQDDKTYFYDAGEIYLMLYLEDEENTAVPAPGGSSLNPSQEDVTTVHEPAIQGGTKPHDTILAPAKKYTKTLSFVKLERLDDDVYPIAVFRFKYSSRESLEHLMIIGRTPSPEVKSDKAAALGSLAGIYNLNSVQKQELEQFLQNLVRDNPSSNSKRRIKREIKDEEEPSRKRARQPSKSATDDATGDSDEGDATPTV